MILRIAVLVLFAITTGHGLDLSMTLEKRHCSLDRVKRILGYSCSNLNLKEIPQSLKSGVVILDMSFNRIRELERASFEKYTDIRYLYLFENMIQTVEPGTFAQLTSLEAIDLSSNALTTIPLELLDITSLRNLYVADNNLFNLEVDLMSLTSPIAAPLQIISLAACKLHIIPNFGILPDLLHANFSQNPLTHMAPIQFAPMCHLKSIDLNGTRALPCSCRAVRSYLGTRNVVLKNGLNNCDSLKCKEQPIDHLRLNETESLYLTCVAARKMQRLEQKKSSILLYSAIAAGVLLVVLLCICCHCRRRKIARKRKKAKARAALKEKTKKLKEENRLVAPTDDRGRSSNSLDTNDTNSIEVYVEKKKVPE